MWGIEFRLKVSWANGFFTPRDPKTEKERQSKRQRKRDRARDRERETEQETVTVCYKCVASDSESLWRRERP